MTEYGVVANVVQAGTKNLRPGAKAWIVGGWGGGGWEKVVVFATSRSGRLITQWVATKHLTAPRVAWVPGHVREKGRGESCTDSFFETKDEDERLCDTIAHHATQEGEV